MAARLLPMPNMLLLCLMTVSCAFNCECPDTYVNAPRPTKVALPALGVSEWCGAAGVVGDAEHTDYPAGRAIVELRPVLLQGLFEGWRLDFGCHAVRLVKAKR